MNAFMNPRVFYIYDWRNCVSIDYVDCPKLACIMLANDISDAFMFFLFICNDNSKRYADDIDVREMPLQGAINNLDVNTDLCVHPDASRARIAELSFMKRMIELSFQKPAWQTFGSAWGAS